MQTLQVIHKLYLSFFGNGGFGVLLLGALAYLLFKRAATRTDRELGVPAAILLCVILSPVSAWVIMRGIGEDVYWRTFWMLPMVTLIAYVLTGITERIPRGWKRGTALVGIALALALNGTLVLGDTFFTYRENNYKLPQDVVETVGLIEEHAASNGIKKKKVVGPEHFATFCRLYDPSLTQPFGRDMAMKPDMQTELFRQINSPEPDYKALTKAIKKKKCRYVVLERQYDDREAMTAKKYECIGETSRYAVYFATRYYKS